MDLEDRKCKKAFFEGYVVAAQKTADCNTNPYENIGNVDEHWFWKEGWGMGNRHRIDIAVLINSISKLRSQ